MIRFATIEDIKKISIIEDESFSDGHYNEEQLIYELKENPFAKFLVEEENKNIKGFLIYMITFNSATIVQIAVLKKERRNGIASKLISAMIEDILKLGYGEVENITLEVRKSNEIAHNFYLKHNFKDVCIKEKYYDNGDDAIYMMRVLL